MTARFSAAGYDIAPFGSVCDVAVVHGCAITRNAERDSLRAARQARRFAPGALVIMTGCPAEILGETLRGDAAPDLVVGHAGKFTLPELLHSLHPGRFPAPPAAQASAPVTPRFDSTRAMVKVQDGCEFRCAYCIVPDARGASVSRPLDAVVDEARRLAACGFKEIVLTGANLGCYRDGARSLADVVRAVETVEGIARIRLSSIEMTTAERAIVDHMACSDKLCRFLHLPLQSGDDGVLAAMGRRYTADDYRRAVDYATRQIPLLGLGTDIIVGFPGESDAAFENTRKLVADLPFSNLHVFPYSRRPGTRADAMPGQIPEPVKQRRVRVLLELEAGKRTAFAAAFTGKEVDVLIESVDQQGTGKGWTCEYLPAEVHGTGLQLNSLIRPTVSRARGGTLVCTEAPGLKSKA